MPANLTPQYNKAEEEYKQARTADEKLSCLKKMLQLLPKHKGTEKIQAELKTKISDMKDEVEKEKKAPKAGTSYKIPKQGAGQVIILGGPNVGKSTILAKLTHATPEIAPYPFTTREPQPGMMAWQDVFVQLIDTPPITSDYLESWLGNMVRVADLALLVVDCGDDDGISAADDVRSKLAQQKTMLVQHLPTNNDDPRIQSIKTLIIANKMDAPDAELRLSMLRDFWGNAYPIIPVSLNREADIEHLRNEIYRSLNVIRVYTKQPGKPVDKQRPFTIPTGGTVFDLAGVIHRDLQAQFKSARIWGIGVFDGQTVKRDHVLHDGDIIEIHT